MTTLLQDLRYAARMLAKSPGTTAIALITLALGIGVNTGMFSFISANEYTVPHRVEEPDRLVSIYRTTEPDNPHSRGPVCPLDYLDYREQAKSFSSIAVYHVTSVTLTGEGEPEKVLGVHATANLLPTLGLGTHLGRLYTEEEDSPAGEHVVLLTDRLWERKFASDPNVLGRTVAVNDTPHTIIGVLTPDFRIEGMHWYRADLLIPLRIDPAGLQRGKSAFWALARLNPGLTREQAGAEMDTIAARLAEAYPQTNAEVKAQIQPLMDALAPRDTLLAFRAMLGAVGLVLLIACLNLANIALARATARGREFAVRAALGAGRGRIVRLLLTESLLLATLGGALGLLIGRWAVDLFILSQEYMPIQRDEVDLNWRVLTYTLVVSGFAGLAFGLAPAITATRVSVTEALKEGQAAMSAGRTRNRLRNTLVVGQLAISLPLLICCGLTLRHVTALMTIDLGYKTERLLTLEVELPERRYASPVQQAAFYREATETIGAIPGIESVGAVLTLPVHSGAVIGSSVRIEGRAAVSRRGEPGVYGYQPVTPGFFETLEVPLIRGRFFTEHDHADAQPVAIINKRMAERYWPDEDPIGSRLTLDKNLSEARWITIVGVVADIGFSVVRPGRTAPTLYLPHEQRPCPSMYVVARTAGDPRGAVSAMRAAIHEIDERIPAHNFRTIQDVMHWLCSDDRLTAGFFGGLALLALSLASIGLYGVMSCAVQQRTHEIGVRVALGASRREIMRLVLKRCLWLAAIGIGVGIALSIPVGLAIESELWGVSGIDPVAYAGVSIVLLAVALQAGYVPARRATKVDPMVALRCE
ncbi:MAG: ABC transporter permease [Phycisphaerales bacterium]|nr:MAG: ABC transporter permease [Phycisphaerales bacterium]